MLHSRGASQLGPIWLRQPRSNRVEQALLRIRAPRVPHEIIQRESPRLNRRQQNREHSTLDTWITGWRPHDLVTSNFPQLRGHCLANYTTDPVFRARLGKEPAADMAATVGLWTQIFGNPLTWQDLPWLRSLTALPLIVKGLCHPDDVRRAIDGGVDAIYCSNHGGRQANGGLAALDCLPDVVAAADGIPVLFDSGVRSGADAIKAIALGATAIGVGRPSGPRRS